jgi:lipopolysaccharide/colanic/teichoic acid biosynthesis glycosyltransferase
MKKIFDLIISSIVLFIFSPLILLIAFLVKKKLGSPILFKQIRPGLDGKLFEMYKFRTMKDFRDKNGNLLPDSERMTSFGSFLRSTSIDELPELINVLKGEMSLVGPRPLLKEYLPLYSEGQARRHNVLPGITGWAQINGRNAISWKKKFELDVWYVENQSFWLDLKILFLTFWKVIKRSDVNQEGHVTIEPFNGNN